MQQERSNNEALNRRINDIESRNASTAWGSFASPAVGAVESRSASTLGRIQGDLDSERREMRNIKEEQINAQRDLTIIRGEKAELDKGAHFTALTTLFVTLFMITKASQKVAYSG